MRSEAIQEFCVSKGNEIPQLFAKDLQRPSVFRDISHAFWVTNISLLTTDAKLYKCNDCLLLRGALCSFAKKINTSGDI